jgi:hypothetical protein
MALLCVKIYKILKIYLEIKKKSIALIKEHISYNNILINLFFIAKENLILGIICLLLVLMGKLKGIGIN